MLGRITSLGIERLVALLLIVFAIAELYEAFQLPVSEEFTLGPGAMPVIYGLGLLIFAGILAVTASRKAAAGSDEGQDVPARDYRAGGVTFALLILFVASIYFFGFLLSTILFSFLHLKLVMRLPVLKAAVFALLWGGGLYYAFDRLLEVQLEPGLVFGGG